MDMLRFSLIGRRTSHGNKVAMGWFRFPLSYFGSIRHHSFQKEHVNAKGEFRDEDTIGMRCESR